MNRDLKELEKNIGYRFADSKLLRQAMIHSSYANERRLPKRECNERMEFLGDAVLELVCSHYLFEQYPDKPEGEMTKLRASVVCEPTLAYCAEEIRLGEYLLLGKGEELTGGRGRSSIVSDAMEALIGAIYLDSGFASAKEFIYRFILKDMEHKQLFYDSKTILQEMVQSEGDKSLVYETVGENGPDHDKKFEARVMIDGQEMGRGVGKSKKAAEAVAAYRAILRLKEMQRALCI